MGIELAITIVERTARKQLEPQYVEPEVAGAIRQPLAKEKQKKWVFHHLRDRSMDLSHLGFLVRPGLGSAGVEH